MILILRNWCFVDVSSSGIKQVKEAWESQRKSHTADFFELDPCLVSFFFTYLLGFFKFCNFLRIWLLGFGK